jgi:hypothetical protein
LDDFLERGELRPDEVSQIQTYLLNVQESPQQTLGASDFDFQTTPGVSTENGFVTPKRFLA